MERRTFLGRAITAALGPSTRAFAFPKEPHSAPKFKTSNLRWQGAYDKALGILSSNVQTLPRFDKPVLIEGANYAGVWMECGPHEALVYRKFQPDVARNTHFTFFALQRQDGQLPANNKATETGFGQIQMVVPIAATAWELAHATGDHELLETAYRGCSAWDDWLMRNRNVRGTGLIEGFCTYDTGHDNSPRWNGIPPQCPDKDAKRYAPIAGLPRLCADLSATVYGARVALSAMAKALGRNAESDRWSERAQEIRRLILSHLYVTEDAAFYDLDAQSRFVKIRCDVLSRVCSEHVPDQALFEDLWKRQIHEPKAFWAFCPLPSVALDDPLFVRPIPRNSWGGASQALTALRAGRWFEHYQRPAEFAFMMDRWCEAIQAGMTFSQQLDPLSGKFTEDASGYSPAALVMLDYTWRLAGVREENDSVEWNVRPGHPAAQSASFRMCTDGGRDAELKYDRQGAELRFGGKVLGRVESGTARLVTSKNGTPTQLVGISEQSETVAIRFAGRAARQIVLPANAKIAL